MQTLLEDFYAFVNRVDLAPFGLANDGEVFQVADRPYGLIEGVVRREGAPEGLALDW